MRSAQHSRSIILTAALCAALVPVTSVAAQPPPAKATGAKPVSVPVAYLKVTGLDYQFESQDMVPAGIVTFNLVNNGADLHSMAVFELPVKHTLKEFLDQYHTQGLIPVWMVGMGQTATIAPNAETFLTMRMKPGRYVLACMIPARDGRMHTEKGMVKLITVK